LPYDALTGNISEKLIFLCHQSARLGKKNRKKFPWRVRPTPYKTFVAEFFLQRTGAIQVSNVFPLFIERYPNLEDALRGKPADIKVLIRPLGLNHRGDAFIRALGQIKTVYKGCLPKDEDSLLSIFGVGKYIARAVSCFGFGQRIGLIDPNITRVLTRFFHIQEIPSRPHTSKVFWDLVDKIINSCDSPPRLFNWGMLDIGREICLKRNPQSHICPLRAACCYIGEKT